MKPIALMSIGLLGSAVTAAGVTGYLAWNSLSGADIESDIKSAPSALTAQPSPSPQLIPQPIAAVPTQAAAYSQPSQAAIPALSQAENDFLFDLSQALQSVEYERLNDPERLAIAEQIVGWLNSGVDYGSVLLQFDAAYGNAIAGDYAFNRDVYIKFAGERFAPNNWLAILTPPEPQFNDHNFNQIPPEHYQATTPEFSSGWSPEFPSDLPPDLHEMPYEMPPYEEPPIGVLVPRPVLPPYAQPYPQPRPYPPYYARPFFPQPHPDWDSEAYPAPQQPPIPQQPTPQQPPDNNPDWYQAPSPDSRPDADPIPQTPQNPDVTEISVQDNPML